MPPNDVNKAYQMGFLANLEVVVLCYTKWKEPKRMPGRSQSKEGSMRYREITTSSGIVQLQQTQGLSGSTILSEAYNISLIADLPRSLTP